ncbi:MAG: hypothetical protein R3A79_05090 [Nannocystaceae bacterium]
MELFAHCLGALLLVNSLPHLLHGVCGYPFPTPFARPRGIGLSPPRTNVLWGGANFAAACALLFGVGELRFGANVDTVAVFAAGAAAALLISASAGRSRRARESGASPAS